MNTEIKIPEGNAKEALKSAISAIYFNDRSKYLKALYSIVHVLAGTGNKELSENDIKSMYEQLHAPVWEPEINDPVVLREGRIGFVVDIDKSRRFAFKVRYQKMGACEWVHLKGMEPYSLEMARKLIGIDDLREPSTPYPNVQASGKIRVEKKEHIKAIQNILEGMGIIHSNNYDGPEGSEMALYWSFGEYYLIKDDIFILNPKCGTHTLSDFGIDETLTYEDLDLGDPVRSPSGREGRVYAKSMTHEEITVEWSDGGRTRFGEECGPYIDTLTKPGGKKPFSVDDAGVVLKDQYGTKWETHTEMGGSDEPYLNAWVHDDDGFEVSVDIPVPPNGKAITGQVFTRVNPKQ